MIVMQQLAHHVHAQQHVQSGCYHDVQHAMMHGFWVTGNYKLHGQSQTFGEWMSSWCCCSVVRKERQRYSNGVMEDDSTEPPFHTDADHREFVSAGAAAGLAVRV